MNATTFESIKFNFAFDEEQAVDPVAYDFVFSEAYQCGIEHASNGLMFSPAPKRTAADWGYRNDDPMFVAFVRGYCAGWDSEFVQEVR